jgi:hypothetical protein
LSTLPREQELCKYIEGTLMQVSFDTQEDRRSGKIAVGNIEAA